MNARREWLVRDVGVYIRGGEAGNLPESFVGSFSYSWELVSTDDELAVVRVTSRNRTTIDSATRIPVENADLHLWPFYESMQGINSSLGGYETISQTIVWEAKVAYD